MLLHVYPTYPHSWHTYNIWSGPWVVKCEECGNYVNPNNLINSDVPYHRGGHQQEITR
jgi:hypothetical protein